MLPQLLTLSSMLSQKEIKYLRSLHLKKYRQKYNIFFAEGEKIADVLLRHSSTAIQRIFATEDWIENHHLPRNLESKCLQIGPKLLGRISALKSANQILVTVDDTAISDRVADRGLKIYLDDIRDPGNMGSMIRIADWFDASILCSPNCVEVRSPKVVQASMGSVFGVPIQEAVDLETLLELKTGKIYGTAMQGEAVGTMKLEKPAILVIGNESRGVSPALDAHVDHWIGIPRQGETSCVDSLNAAIATGIVCSYFK